MRKDNERGAIVVEATLSLTAFVFTIFTILTLVNIYFIQAKMQIALNNTAQEISQYSYIYGMTGLDESLAKFQTEANNTKSDVNGLVGNTISV